MTENIGDDYTPVEVEDDVLLAETGDADQDAAGDWSDADSEEVTDDGAVAQ